MSANKKDTITIIGSGLAGSFLATLLSERGYTVEVYERLARKDICDNASKRSYNIVLFGYGIEILKKTGLWKDIKPHLMPLKGSVTHISKETKPIIFLTDEKKSPYFTISRALLADILMKKAEKHAKVTFHYESELLSIDRHERTILVQNTKTKKTTTVACDVIIGTDGANSLVRSFMQQGLESHHTQEYASWSYKQFLLSPNMVEKLHLEKKFVHVWTQKNAFIILHPDHDDSLAALLVYPKGKDAHALTTQSAIKKFFTANFPELIPALVEISPALLENPDGNFATIHTEPWYYKNFITIAGDAAHGFYPFFGQGTSAAFGDCMELVKLIDAHGTNWEKVFPKYQKERKKNTDALGELSKEALLKYLRDKKADYEAIYDRLELTMYRLFPKFIYPPLSMTIPTDPGHAAMHREQYLKQKKIAKNFGIPFLVSLLADTVNFYEQLKPAPQSHE